MACALFPLSQLLKMHADICAADFEMQLAGASQPMVAASRARLSGSAAVARQATLPPRTAEVSCPAFRLQTAARRHWRRLGALLVACHVGAAPPNKCRSSCCCCCCCPYHRGGCL